METAERMMIAGMVLQGLVANPAVNGGLFIETIAAEYEDVEETYAAPNGDPLTRSVRRETKPSYTRIHKTLQGEQRNRLVAEALAITAVLEGKTPDEQGEPHLVSVIRICSVAWSVAAAIWPKAHPVGWAEADDELKQQWVEAVDNAMAGAELLGQDQAVPQIDGNYFATPLSEGPRQIIKAVVAGWLNADG